MLWTQLNLQKAFFLVKEFLQTLKLLIEKHTWTGLLLASTFKRFSKQQKSIFLKILLANFESQKPLLLQPQAIKQTKTNLLISKTLLELILLGFSKPVQKCNIQQCALQTLSFFVVYFIFYQFLGSQTEVESWGTIYLQ